MESDEEEEEEEEEEPVAGDRPSSHSDRSVEVKGSVARALGHSGCVALKFFGEFNSCGIC